MKRKSLALVLLGSLLLTGCASPLPEEEDEGSAPSVSDGEETVTSNPNGFEVSELVLPDGTTVTCISLWEEQFECKADWSIE